MSKPIDFEFKTRFDVNFKPVPIGGDYISKASLDGLKPLIPVEIDLEKNYDLVGVAFDGALANVFNRNNDGISSKEAAKILDLFIHKPANIEHNLDAVVGHIVSASFRKILGELISKEEAAETTEPLNISLGGVVYKYTAPEFARLLEKANDPNDKLYQSVSASWEIGFSKYDIAVGGEKMDEVEIIKDPKIINELTKYLKSKGGNGKLKDGSNVHRLLNYGAQPLAFGFTFNPAAKVKGVLINESGESNEEEEAKASKKTFFIKKNNAQVSQTCIADVKTTKKTTMEIETILADIKATLDTKKFSETAIANMTETFAAAIKQRDAEYQGEIAKVESEKQEQIGKLEKMQASIDELQDKLQKTTEQLSQFETEKLQVIAVARLNTRMEEIDQIYALENEDRKIILEDLGKLGEDETAFASYKDRLSIMWKHKSKASVQAAEEAVQKKIQDEIEKLKISKASDTTATAETSIASAMDAATATTQALPNASVETSADDLRAKFGAAFDRKNIEISH